MAVKNFGDFGELQAVRQSFFRQYPPHNYSVSRESLRCLVSCHVVQCVKSCGQLAMSILKYFKRIDHVSSNSNVLPDPEGPLSSSVPSEAIASGNKRVREVVDKCSDGKRGPYLTLTPAQKLLIGQRAAEYGTTSAIRTFAKKYPELPLQWCLPQRFL